MCACTCRWTSSMASWPKATCGRILLPTHGNRLNIKNSCLQHSTGWIMTVSPILSIIPVMSQWGRYNLSLYLLISGAQKEWYLWGRVGWKWKNDTLWHPSQSNTRNWHCSYPQVKQKCQQLPSGNQPHIHQKWPSSISKAGILPSTFSASSFSIAKLRRRDSLDISGWCKSIIQIIGVMYWIIL